MDNLSRALPGSANSSASKQWGFDGQDFQRPELTYLSTGSMNITRPIYRRAKPSRVERPPCPTQWCSHAGTQERKRAGTQTRGHAGTRARRGEPRTCRMSLTLQTGAESTDRGSNRRLYMCRGLSQSRWRILAAAGKRRYWGGSRWRESSSSMAWICGSTKRSTAACTRGRCAARAKHTR